MARSHLMAAINCLYFSKKSNTFISHFWLCVFNFFSHLHLICWSDLYAFSFYFCLRQYITDYLTISGIYECPVLILVSDSDSLVKIILIPSCLVVLILAGVVYLIGRYHCAALSRTLHRDAGEGGHLTCPQSHSSEVSLIECAWLVEFNDQLFLHGISCIRHFCLNCGKCLMTKWS